MLIDVFSLNTFAIVNRKRSFFESDLTVFFALGEKVDEIKDEIEKKISFQNKIDDDKIKFSENIYQILFEFLRGLFQL